MSWWLIAMKKYVDFSGRARRKEYWMFVLFSFIFGMAAVMLDILLGMANENMGVGVFYALFSLAILLPTLAVTVRRLHDTGRSGWWFLISLVPFIGGLWLLILTLLEGQAGANRYGENPKLAV